MTTYYTFTLDNGLRVIQYPAAGDVIYCGYALKVGSRDELAGEDGLAHFCEHASFKGTSRRRGSQVIRALEEVGGELNAYTNKESTVYYCACLREHLPRAIDLLTDMVFHSTFPEVELEKEKEVICDEIESYNDSPAELIYDDFDNILFHGHPLGHNILGTKESVRAFTSADARRFTQRHYLPSNAVFFISGIEPKPLSVKERLSGKEPQLITLLKSNFSKYPLSPAPTLAEKSNGDGSTCQADAASNESREEAEHMHVQSSPLNGERGGLCHVIMGGKAYDINHPRRIALYLLNNILGGPAMSSRLNMSLREKHGLVYTVESTMVSYADTGMWCIYFGCDHDDVKRCMRLVRHELGMLMQKPLSERQLSMAKKQLKGQIALACDNRESFALDFAKSFLHYGWEKDVTALYANIDKLTADDLHLVAQELFREESIETLIYDK